MCYDCWKNKYNAPKIINENVKKTIDLIQEIYKTESTGGDCHIVLDDFNIENDHIQWCIDWINRNEIPEIGPEVKAIELECMNLMLTMSIDERAIALALADGYINEKGE
jgi:hypothetical protein